MSEMEKGGANSHGSSDGDKSTWARLLQKFGGSKVAPGSSSDTGSLRGSIVSKPPAVAPPSLASPLMLRQQSVRHSSISATGLGLTSRLHSTLGGSLQGGLASRAHSMLAAPQRAMMGHSEGDLAMLGGSAPGRKARRMSLFTTVPAVGSHSMGAPKAGLTSPALDTRVGSLAVYLYAPHPLPGKGLAFSPDGKMLLRYGYGTDVRLLSSNNGSSIGTPVSPSGSSLCFAAFSGDSRHLLAASEDCQVYVWSVPDLALVGTINTGDEPATFAVLSYDGLLLLTCNDEGELQLWSLASGALLHRLDEVGHASRACSFGVNDACIISCSSEDCTITLLDVHSGKASICDTFEEVSESRNSAEYVISADGSKVILYLTEQTFVTNLVLYDTTSNAHIPLYVCDGSVTHVEFSVDSQFFVTSGRDDGIHVWDASDGSTLNTLGGHSSDVLFAKVSADGQQVISGDNSGTVLCWDLQRGASTLKLQGHLAPVCYCDMSADRKRAITVDVEGHAYLWFLDVQSVLEVLRESSDMLCSVQLNSQPSTHMAVGYSDGFIKYWDIDTVSVEWSHEQHGCPVHCIAISSCGKQLASAGRDGLVLITDTRNGSVLGSVQAHTDVIVGLLFSEEDQALITASRDGLLCIWAMPLASAPMISMSAPGLERPEIFSIALSGDGKYVSAACSTGMVCVWLADNGELAFELMVTDVQCTQSIFSDDSCRLFCSSADGSTSVFELATGSKTVTLLGNASSMNSIFFVEAPKPSPTSFGMSQADPRLVTVCGRQAISWDGTKVAMMADFISDTHGAFGSTTMQGRTFVAHSGVSLYDPTLATAVYDMLPSEKPLGNSFLMRNNTGMMPLGTSGLPCVVFVPPATTVHMLAVEAGGVKCLDFSSDGHMLVSGSLRGELSVYDVQHRTKLHQWSAHKRSAITCVKFTHDNSNVYSCGEDCKVILWDWRTQKAVATLTGHMAPVTSVEMSLDGSVMASGDKDGFVFVWDCNTRSPKQVVQVHQGAVLCCSLSPDGSKVASSGADEHIAIIDTTTGMEVMVLDEALDGKGLTIKFSFDGTRVQVGGENGSVLVWDVVADCLLYDIPAHEGKVWDCSWSGDSRRLLSVGSDGLARLWDTAAGSELCKGDFEKVLGAVELGGLIKCDLSVDGSYMAGCTSKGQLILWDVARERHREPDGSMLYKWLASMPLSRARNMYRSLLDLYPLLMNAQDGHGWTVLMHAAHNRNPEITKLIISCVPAGSGRLGLTTSALANSPGTHHTERGGHGYSGSSVAGSGGTAIHHHGSNGQHSVTNGQQHSASGGVHPSALMRFSPAGHLAGTGSSVTSGHGNGNGVGAAAGSILSAMGKSFTGRTLAMRQALSGKESGKSHFGGSAELGSGKAHHPASQLVHSSSGLFGNGIGTGEPNAIKIALNVNSADCVQHMLAAVLAEKVTRGSYHSITDAVASVSQQYPSMCEHFLLNLPLTRLGEMEVPSAMAATQVVRAANSYTSYKEMWTKELKLDEMGQGPMAVMEASMVRLPFCANPGSGSILQMLIKSDVPVDTYGSPTVKAIIDFKWAEFARKRIYTKSLMYFLFVTIFTVFAVISSNDMGEDSLHVVLETHQGRLKVALAAILFLCGLYYISLEAAQLYTMGMRAYWASFWNFLDVASYTTILIICPCYVFRYGLQRGSFTPVLVALETIMLWFKVLFFALAVDGIGTFIFVTIEIVKGMKHLMVLLFSLFLSFGVAFMILFRDVTTSQLLLDQQDVNPLIAQYSDFGNALLNSVLVVLGQADPRMALASEWPQIATIAYCGYMFTIMVVLLNMLISLMTGIYEKVCNEQVFVFLQGRAELIIEAESTAALSKAQVIQPYLHILMPITKENEGGEESTSDNKLVAMLQKIGITDLATSGLPANGGEQDDGGFGLDADARSRVGRATEEYGDDGSSDGGGSGGASGEDDGASMVSGRTHNTYRGGGRREKGGNISRAASVRSVAPARGAVSRNQSVRSHKIIGGNAERLNLQRGLTRAVSHAAADMGGGGGAAAAFTARSRRFVSGTGGGGGGTSTAALERAVAQLSLKMDALANSMRSMATGNGPASTINGSALPSAHRRSHAGGMRGAGTSFAGNMHSPSAFKVSDGDAGSWGDGMGPSPSGSRVPLPSAFSSRPTSFATSASNVCATLSAAGSGGVPLQPQGARSASSDAQLDLQLPTGVYSSSTSTQHAATAFLGAAVGGGSGANTIATGFGTSAHVVTKRPQSAAVPHHSAMRHGSSSHAGEVLGSEQPEHSRHSNMRASLRPHFSQSVSPVPPRLPDEVLEEGSEELHSSGNGSNPHGGSNGLDVSVNPGANSTTAGVGTSSAARPTFARSPPAAGRSGTVHAGTEDSDDVITNAERTSNHVLDGSLSTKQSKAPLQPAAGISKTAAATAAAVAAAATAAPRMAAAAAVPHAPPLASGSGTGGGAGVTLAHAPRLRAQLHLPVDDGGSPRAGGGGGVRKEGGGLAEGSMTSRGPRNKSAHVGFGADTGGKDGVHGAGESDDKAELPGQPVN